MQQQQTISQSNCEMQWKVDFMWQPVITKLLDQEEAPKHFLKPDARPRRSSKALLKAKLAPKKGHGHCFVVCCHSDPLQLSESQRNHYIWEVSSANWWDALKTATLAAAIGQHQRANSPWQHSTACLTTTTSKVEWIRLWSFASSTIFI